MAHAGEAEAEGRLTAPMPGKIVAVVVKNGQEERRSLVDHGSDENGTHDLSAP